MKPNDQAAAFLHCLGGNNFIFQTFTDSKEKRKKIKEEALGRPFDPLAKVLIGTFDEHKEELRKLNVRGAGIFVQVNKGSKRGKSFVTAIRSVFVDFDNPKTTKQSIETIKQYMPKPSIVVQSNPGKFHIYWKVTNCPIDKFTAMQMQLAVKFYSDGNVKNLDRVMRLPGFNHNKAAPFLVTATLFDESYDLDTIYKAAAKAPILTPTTSEAPTPRVPNAPTKKDVFGLNMGGDYEVPTVLAQGDRTGKLMAHIGHMVGTGHKPQEIRNEIMRMNIALCPEGQQPIPEGTLEMEVMGAIDKYCMQRDVENEAKAVEAFNNNNPIKKETVAGEVPKPPMSVAEEIMDRYVLAVEGQRVIDTYAAGEYKVSSLADFKLAMKNVGTKRNDLVAQWIEDPQRKSCRDVMWYPVDQEFIDEDVYKFYNLYRKPKVVAVANEDFDLSKLDIFFEHMLFLFPDAKDREFFLNWFAKSVTSPTVRIPWAPLIISDPGAGKGFVYQVLAQLTGVDNADVITMQSLESQFNPFMMCSSVLLIDEVSNSKQTGFKDKLNAYISEERLKINRKGMQERTFPIYANVIMFSNNDDAAHLQDGDRRYWVHRIKGVKPSTYYDYIFSWFKKETETSRVIYTDNLEHLMRWCIERDLSKFKHNHKPPLTVSKAEMIYASRSQLDIDLQDSIDNREGPFGADIVAVPIVKQYLSTKRDQEIKTSEERQISRLLTKISPSTFVRNALNTIDDNIPGRFRVRCVRNFEYWSEQPTASIRRELTRSMQMHLNHRDVLPPDLAVVTGESDAKTTQLA